MVDKTIIHQSSEDLHRSIDFFTWMGFAVIDELSGPDTVCFELNTASFLMLHKPKKFETITGRPNSNPLGETEMVISLNADSADNYEKLVERAEVAGARHRRDLHDGYRRSTYFTDPDGHRWEVYFPE